MWLVCSFLIYCERQTRFPYVCEFFQKNLLINDFEPIRWIIIRFFLYKIIFFHIKWVYMYVYRNQKKISSSTEQCDWVVEMFSTAKMNCCANMGSEKRRVFWSNIMTTFYISLTYTHILIFFLSRSKTKSKFRHSQ